jgi:hypothetical protein
MRKQNALMLLIDSEIDKALIFAVAVSVEEFLVLAQLSDKSFHFSVVVAMKKKYT